MTREELLRHVLRGRLLIVGEFRGASAEATGYVDRKTGNAIKYVQAIYVIECASQGMLDRAIMRQKLKGFDDPEDVQFPQEKGKLYVFLLDSFKWERGGFSGWISDRETKPIEALEEAGCAPSGAFPLPNLVHMETTPQTQ